MAGCTVAEIDAGIFLVDKPVHVTSFAVVSRLRRILRIKRVGHAGTLDPFATGLLVVCAGRPATRLVSRLMDGPKEYLATLRLGVETATQDPEGVVTARKEVGEIASATIEECLAAFRGRQLQVPPAYSALKYKGKPLYHYARKGIEVVKAPREIEISRLERIDGGHSLTGDTADMAVRVVCSKGTYIRTLAADIGRRLGCGAHLVQLRRTRSGCFAVDQSLAWDELQDDQAIDHCLNKMITVEQVCKLLQ